MSETSRLIQIKSDAYVSGINSAIYKYLEKIMEKFINAIIWLDTVFTKTRDPFLEEYRRPQRQMVVCAISMAMGIICALIIGNLSYSQPVPGILQGLQDVVERFINIVYIGCLVVVIGASIAYCWIAYQFYCFTNE